MIKGAVARSSLSTSFTSEKKEVPNHITVVGGGIAGIEASLSLSNLGYQVALLEIEEELGGHVIHLPVVAPTGKSGREVLSGRLASLENDENVKIMTKTNVKFVEGEMGNFTIHYLTDEDEEEKTLQTSAVVLATGFEEFKPNMMDEYRYGKNPDVVTQFELSQMLTKNELVRPSDGQPVKDIVMVQCVGSRSEDYKRDCSKLCCTFAIDNSLQDSFQGPLVSCR